MMVDTLPPLQPAAGMSSLGLARCVRAVAACVCNTGVHLYWYASKTRQGFSFLFMAGPGLPGMLREGDRIDAGRSPFVLVVNSI